MTAGVVSCMLLRWGVVFVGMVIRTSSPILWNFLLPAGGWSASRVLLCVRVFPLLIKHHPLAIYL